MKRLLPLLLALPLFALPTHAQETQKAPEPPIQTMANGLQVQTDDIRTLLGDTEQMLGIYLWKVRLSTAEKGKGIKVKLELRTPGKEPQQFGGFGSSLFEKSDYIFGIRPIDGNNIYSSLKALIYSRTSSYTDGKEGREAGNSIVFENPFLNLGGLSVPYEPLVRLDGSILLMTFKPTNIFDGSKNSELVVVATLTDPPAAK